MSVKILLQRTITIPHDDKKSLSNYIIERDNKLYLCKNIGKGETVILNESLEVSLLDCRSFFTNFEDNYSNQVIENCLGVKVYTNRENYIMFNSKFKNEIEIDNNIVNFDFNFGDMVNPEIEELKIDFSKYKNKAKIKFNNQTLILFY